MDKFDNIIDNKNYMDSVDFYEIIDYIIYDLKLNNSEDTSIEEYGLLFDTLKKSKRKGIYKTYDILNKLDPIYMLGDSIFPFSICNRDEMILRHLLEEEQNKVTDYIHSHIIEKIEERNPVEVRPKKQKRKFLSMFKQTYFLYIKIIKMIYFLLIL